MHCNPLTDPACVAGHLIKSITGGVTGNVLGGIAQAINSGVEWVVTNTATWWVRIPSPDLASEPAVTRIQQWLLPIAAAVALGAVIAAGARMALTRRANPLLDVTGGLLTIAVTVTCEARQPMPHTGLGETSPGARYRRLRSRCPPHQESVGLRATPRHPYRPDPYRASWASNSESSTA